VDPLVHTDEGLDQLMVLAERGAPAMYVPGIQFGLTGPATLAGGIVVGLADTLVGLLVGQLVKEGAPFVAATFIDNLNFARLTASHSGTDATLAKGASADVFRHLALPFCVNLGATDAGPLDQVAAADAAFQLYSAALSGQNMVMMGSFEAGNLTNLAGLVFADELLGSVERLVAGVEVSEVTLAEAAIEKVGPGGTFIGHRHTRTHYRDLWMPTALEGRAYDSWVDAGKPDLAESFAQRAREIVAAGPRDPLDDKVVAELQAILTTAERELPRDS
jgi:trimethylamine--corrinoid protein Co-methyltransferase